MPWPPRPLESVIFRWNSLHFLPHIEAQPKLTFCESARSQNPQDHQHPSFPQGISMIFLPILRSTLGSNFANSRCPPAPWTTRILHFPVEFLAFSSPILKHNLNSCSAIPPGGSRFTTSESFIFLRNFNDFPPHTEVYPRLKFCDCALCVGFLDPQNPSFS